MNLLVGGVLLALLTVLVFTVIRQRRHINVLQSRLESLVTELQQVQQSCSRFTSADMLNQVLTDGAASAPERKDVTVMFADIVGYTPLSEGLEPAVVARILNGYYQRMSDVISQNGGYVSTFLGDGILAYFGALRPNPWQCDDALRAALAMQGAVIDYNVELKGEGLPPLAVGTGLHRGIVLAGLIGTRERMEYACVGRAVNLAARVQTLTRDHNVAILLTESVKEKLDSRVPLRPLPAMPVKGIVEPVLTYTVIPAA